MTSSPYEQAIAQFRSGRIDLGFQSAIEAMRSMEPQKPAELALLCLAEANQLGAVDQVLALGRERGLHPMTLCLLACVSMLGIGRRNALHNLATHMPAGHPLRILSLYYAACARMVAGDVEGALQECSLFRNQVKDYFPTVPFISSDAFNISFRQGTLVLPAAEVGPRLARAADCPPASTDFVLDRMAAVEGRSLYAVVADGRYVARFARGLATALDRPGRALHIHVVNSGEDADRILSRLPDEVTHLGIGVSRSLDRHYATSTSYACSRFFVLPELLRAYGTPMISMDIDIHPLAPLARLEAALPAADFDFACYVTGRNEPASVYLAGLLALPRGPATIGFLEELGEFCLPKLNMPARFNWLLDQAALMSVLNWKSVTKAAFRFRPLNGILGCAFNDAAAPVASEEEKGGIKGQNNAIEQGLAGADGRVRYDWFPD